MTTGDDHALRMSTTNTGAFCATCACGWIGIPKLVPVTKDAKGKKKRHPALAERDARAEYNAHAYVLDPGGEMRTFRCEVCRREWVMAKGSTTCPHDGGSLALVRAAL